MTERAEHPPEVIVGKDGKAVTVPRQSSKATLRRTKRTGQAAYMGVLLAVVQERSELLGLYPAEKRDAMVSGVGISFELLQKIRERRQLAEAEERATGVPMSLIHALRADDEPEPVA